MKRLKMPKIPTRIPLPDLSSIHIRSSQKAKDTSNNDVVLPAATETAQDTKPVEQTKEDKKIEQSTKTVSRIPLPSISKPSIRKPSVPKIPLPSISKPSVPKFSAPRIPLPSISRPNIFKKSSPNQAKVQSETSENAAPLASPTTGADALEQPREKGKVSIHKISMPKMPSIHKSKEKQSSQQPAAPPTAEHETAADATAEPEKKNKAKVNIQKIHLPAMPALHKAKGKPIATAENASTPQLEETKTTAKTSEAKGKSKVSMSKFKFAKVSAPSMSPGKSRAKSTGKHILALSIEGTDIRMLSYHNNSIESWKSVAFDARFLKMGQVADPEGLGTAIKTAVTGIETSRCYVVCALPGLRSVSRIISVPNLGKKEMETIVPREVRRTMTVSEEDNYFHWQVLPTEEAQARVFVVAVPKEPLSLLLRAFNHAGLNPAQVDLKPLALMRAINQKDAIIANCEGNSMELVIVSDDVPVLIRSVFLGEGVVNQDYAVGRISDELGRTIVTYNEINKEHPLDPTIPVYLTGAAAAGVPFALNVAALTGRTVQPLESFINCPADLPTAEYMVNIGLILKVL
jgi:hypothetical protein